MHRVDPEGLEIRNLAELSPVEGLRVLELGCGEGRLTFQIASAAKWVLAVDPDEERLNAARAALPSSLADKVELAVAGATEVDSSRGEFDLALFSWSL